MTIVVVVPACPHPFGDTAAKWFDVLIRELVRRGHRVDLVCATEEPDARVEQSQRALSSVSGAGRLDVSFHRLTISRHPIGRKLYSLWRPFSETVQADGIRRAVHNRLARGCDVLHAEQLWSGWLIAGVPRSLLNVHHLEVIDREQDQPRSWTERKTRWQMRRRAAHYARVAQGAGAGPPRAIDRRRLGGRSIPGRARGRSWTRVAREHSARTRLLLAGRRDGVRPTPGKWDESQGDGSHGLRRARGDDY